MENWLLAGWFWRLNCTWLYDLMARNHRRKFRNEMTRACRGKKEGRKEGMAGCSAGCSAGGSAIGFQARGKDGDDLEPPRDLCNDEPFNIALAVHVALVSKMCGELEFSRLTCC
jgi:hypothetical protein